MKLDCCFLLVRARYGGARDLRVAAAARVRFRGARAENPLRAPSADCAGFTLKGPGKGANPVFLLLLMGPSQHFR